MNMTNTAADEALEGVGMRQLEASGEGGWRHRDEVVGGARMRCSGLFIT
jgi:hypothetical protein